MLILQAVELNKADATGRFPLGFTRETTFVTFYLLSFTARYFL